MSILSDNLRYLRARKRLSQKAIASFLLMERGRYSKYEEDFAEPPLEILQRLAKFHVISIDLLVSVDLRNVPLDQLLIVDVSRVVIPITRGNEFIEIVKPVK